MLPGSPNATNHDLPSGSARQKTAAVIGGGPAGLMAAEVISQGELQVDLYEAKPSIGRKFLVAGKGGLNLTHSEPYELFLGRYGRRRPQIEPLLDAFGPQAIRRWASELGFETFVGSSGKVFPEGLKAAPLLRAWKQRLLENGVRFHLRHRWLGWGAGGILRFETPGGEITTSAQALVLALGGGSWPQLGSTGEWVPVLSAAGVPIAPLKPANCGFDVGWSAIFRSKYEGQPVKPVVLSFNDSQGYQFQGQGEFIITQTGLEGSLIYAVSGPARDEIEAHGEAVIHLDLAPDWPLSLLVEKLSRPRGTRTVSSHLARTVGLKGVRAGLLREFVPRAVFDHPDQLAAVIKDLPVRLKAARPLVEAISSAGGVRFEALDEHLMIRSMPGVFCAGEMLDWEAPTGGYLLTACFASGRAAGKGALAWLEKT